MAQPTISGTVANQQTTQDAPFFPFSGILIDDPNAGAPTDTLTIDLTNDGTGQQGTFTSGGFGTLTEVSPGHWTLVDFGREHSDRRGSVAF